MALNLLTAPVADDPASFVAPSVAHIANSNFEHPRFPRFDSAGGVIVAGATFNVGGSVYVSSGTTAITGAVSSAIVITPTGATATASYASDFSGVAWNEANKGWYSGDSLFIFTLTEPNYWPQFLDISAGLSGNYQRHLYGGSADGEYVPITSSTYALSTGKVVPPFSGRINVSFRLASNTGGYVNGRVYINDVAVGTERSTRSDEGETFSEYFDVTAGDKIEVYCKRVSDSGTISQLGISGYPMRNL